MEKKLKRYAIKGESYGIEYDVVDEPKEKQQVADNRSWFKKIKDRLFNKRLAGVDNALNFISKQEERGEFASNVTCNGSISVSEQEAFRQYQEKKEQEKGKKSERASVAVVE